MLLSYQLGIVSAFILILLLLVLFISCFVEWLLLLFRRELLNNLGSILGVAELASSFVAAVASSFFKIWVHLVIRKIHAAELCNNFVGGSGSSVGSVLEDIGSNALD